MYRVFVAHETGPAFEMLYNSGRYYWPDLLSQVRYSTYWDYVGRHQ